MTRPGMTVFGTLLTVALLDGASGGHWGRALFWFVAGCGFAALDWAEIHSRPA